jgi:hypothetical protein
MKESKAGQWRRDGEPTQHLDSVKTTYLLKEDNFVFHMNV